MQEASHPGEFIFFEREPQLFHKIQPMKNTYVEIKVKPSKAIPVGKFDLFFCHQVPVLWWHLILVNSNGWQKRIDKSDANAGF